MAINIHGAGHGIEIAVDTGIAEQKPGNTVFDGISEAAGAAAMGNEPKRCAYIWLSRRARSGTASAESHCRQKYAAHRFR